ncbi:MAG: hypothetical protein H6733_09560 [Alphaproteobacteria bacterium]|nr:hypothetical protein [Alphaproteobacteria bacterium]
MRVALALVTLGVVGCGAHKPPKAAGEVVLSPACVALASAPPPTCTPDPGAGTDPRHALAWAEQATGSLWSGRLLCPSGALANATRVQWRAQAHQESLPESQARIDAGDLIDVDIVDRWTVSCPGEDDHVWFANIYRCGNPCPPDGFTVFPDEAAAAVRTGYAQLELGDTLNASLLAARALSAAPDTEPPYRLLYQIALKSQKVDTALKALDALEELRPGDADLLVRHALVAGGAGRRAELDEVLLALRLVAKEGHPLAPEVACLETLRARMDGAPAEVVDAGVRAACDGGSSICCQALETATPAEP